MTICPPLDLIQSWVAVVDFKSVSQAAVHLGVSQAAVSQHIQALEEFVGVSLLDRSFRPARPTPAGLRFYDDACRLLEQGSQIVINARNLGRAKGTMVRIGCVDSFAATVCPQLVKGLSGSSSKITLWSGITPVLDEQMNTRQIDVAITTVGTTKRSGIVRQRLFSENYFAVFPRRFLRQENEDVQQLVKRLQFIRYSLRSAIGEQIQGYFDGLGVEPERTFEFDATDPLLSLVAAGLGWALITPLCLWQSRHHLPDVAVVPLNKLFHGKKNLQPLERTFFMLWRQDELGTLPLEIRNIVTEVARRQLAPEIAKAIGVSEDELFTFPR